MSIYWAIDFSELTFTPSCNYALYYSDYGDIKFRKNKIINKE